MTKLPAALPIAILSAVLGYATETHIDAYCSYGGDCIQSPPGGTCAPAIPDAHYCGQTPQFNAYYDPYCGSNYCCDGFYWCWNEYDNSPCVICGSTNYSFCSTYCP